MKMPASISEDHGIELLLPSDLMVYSAGISTAGVAEARMAELQAGRTIVATTIDVAGAEFAREELGKRGQLDQIQVKIEDVAEPLEYPDGHFDFVYARLVLHYLSKQRLQKSLAELSRVTKDGGRLYVVVRSNECVDAVNPTATYDPETCLTTNRFDDQKPGKTSERFYHSPESIGGFVTEAGFRVVYTSQYDELLYVDFMRQQVAPHPDNVVELLAVKE